MLHNVLVCLDGSQGWSAQQACQEIAYEFAAQYRARLIGLHVRPDAASLAPVVYPPEVAVGAAMAFASMEASQRTQLAVDAVEEERAEQFVNGFLAGARSAGVEAICHSVRGDLVDEIVQFGHAADLILLPDAHAPTSPAWPLGRLCRATARPVLLASQCVVPFRRIAVAYDGSLGADRALQVAVDMAVNWPPPQPELILLAVSDAPHARLDVLAPAEQYLRGYSLKYRTRIATGRPSEGIVNAADEEAANLLCMGAYNHSTLREALLGSTTDEVVEQRHQPLILCH